MADSRQFKYIESQWKEKVGCGCGGKQKYGNPLVRPVDNTKLLTYTQPIAGVVSAPSGNSYLVQLGHTALDMELADYEYFRGDSRFRAVAETELATMIGTLARR